jgi:hypothetical protein
LVVADELEGDAERPAHVHLVGQHTSPTATNAIGALTLKASRRAETRPHTTSDAAIATINLVSRLSTPLLLVHDAIIRRAPATGVMQTA